MLKHIYKNLENKRISKTNKIVINDYIFIIGIYNYLNFNNKLNYHIRIYTKDYKNITSILRYKKVFNKTYKQYAITDELKNINDTDYLNHISYILDNIMIDRY